MVNNLTASIVLDLGTTAIKAGLLDRNGELGNIIARPAPLITAHDGRYESDSLAYAEIAEQVLGACSALAGDCRSLGLCSQRSSFLIWEQATGQPLTPLVSWQDNRGAASCAALRAHEKSIRDLAGLPLTPYYFAPKLRSMLLGNPGWLARLESGELRVGTLDSFLIWRWSGGKYFVTDASMAARTLLMDIRQQQWSPQLCEFFGIPLGILPEIISSAEMNLSLNNGLVLQASTGDQSAALIASISENQPEALVNLGTGCFVMRYFSGGKSALGGYLNTLVYTNNAQHPHYAIEGTLNSVAAALAPYPVGECNCADLAMDNIFCVAEPSGLGAPYFRGDIGIRYSESVEHLSQRRIATLLLEAVIFRVVRILEDLHRESAIERVYLSGGLSGLLCLQQGIAQCVPFEVYRLDQSESSLQGAALLAAGMTPASHRRSETISITGNTDALPKKYRRWKMWLDELLTS
ncbi:MAG: Carbohydrate kinase, FGGY [Candidatus Gallionella acididurans]|uniref:Carbohydrate kinase, FGGY n=1 Tax=Candidatus Gallionella acididurans TaxID=1796491 RepID=A0A139BQF6_9PROT|nr:MAG: Carbohydrate kinase, FGGY [Candidatus Gallionella acididurans]